MDDMRIDIIKGVIAFFLILNIVTLGFGYYLIDNKFTENNNNYNSEVLAVLRKKETLLEDINIVNKSKEDIYANLKQLEQNISVLKTKINDSSKEFSSISDQTVYYQDKLSLVQNKNAELNNQKVILQNQLNVKNQQAALRLKQQQDAANAVASIKPVRRTRSS